MIIHMGRDFSFLQLHLKNMTNNNVMIGSNTNDCDNFQAVKTRKREIKAKSNLPTTLTLNGKQFTNVCPNWINLEHDHMSWKCCNNMTHPFMGKDVMLRVCRDYLMGKCRYQTCRFQHPSELKPVQSSNSEQVHDKPRFVVRTNNIKNMMCFDKLVETMKTNGFAGRSVTFVPENNTNYKRRECRGDNCWHAHTAEEQATSDVCSSFSKTEWNKVNLIAIDEALRSLMREYKDLVVKFTSKVMFQRINSPESLPFESLLNLWQTVASYFRALNKGKPRDEDFGFTPGSGFGRTAIKGNAPEFELNIEGISEDWVWRLHQSTTLCRKYANMVRKIYDDLPLVESESDICTGGKNCNKGMHDPSHLISIKNMMTGEKDDDINIARAALAEKIAYLEDEIKTTPEVVWEKINTFGFKGMGNTKVKREPRKEKIADKCDLEYQLWLLQPKVFPTDLGLIPLYEQQALATPTEDLTEFFKQMPVDKKVVEFLESSGVSLDEFRNNIKPSKKMFMKRIRSSSFQQKVKTAIWAKYSATLSDEEKTKVYPIFSDWFDFSGKRMSFGRFYKLYQMAALEFVEYNKQFDDISDASVEKARKWSEDDGVQKYTISQPISEKITYLDAFGFMMKWPIEQDKRLTFGNKLKMKYFPTEWKSHVETVAKGDKTKTFLQIVRSNKFFDGWCDLLSNNYHAVINNPAISFRYLYKNYQTINVPFKVYLDNKIDVDNWYRVAYPHGLSLDTYLSDAEAYELFYVSGQYQYRTFTAWKNDVAEGWEFMRYRSPGNIKDVTYFSWEFPRGTIIKEYFVGETSRFAGVVDLSHEGLSRRTLVYKKDDDRDELFNKLVHAIKEYSVEDITELSNQATAVGITGWAIDEAEKMIKKQSMKAKKSSKKVNKKKNVSNSDSDSDSDSDDEIVVGGPALRNFGSSFVDPFASMSFGNQMDSLERSRVEMKTDMLNGSYLNTFGPFKVSNNTDKTNVKGIAKKLSKTFGATVRADFDGKDGFIIVHKEMDPVEIRNALQVMHDIYGVDEIKATGTLYKLDIKKKVSAAAVTKTKSLFA